ncbi:MAG: PAC2 family protein [Desulfobacterota bacterium]|nr:PAC2 family protein [Thermodesulfobacteriota bacterium]MDW8001738.1 PAC2 family protein [Deltaproteobacteria bacterium]
MRIGNFEVEDLAETPKDPIAIAALWPWIDVNNVGTAVLREIRNRYNARLIGRLATPGLFYDFTRYRPQIELEDEIKGMSIPNTTVYLARREGNKDLILIRMREPHSHAELFVRSVLKLLTVFGVKTYIVVGSMYDAVPHTRPLIVNGYGMGESAKEIVRKNGVLSISYRGPSSIVNMVTKKAYESGIETMVFIVSIPQYVILDEDYAGKLRLIELLSRIIDIPVDQDDYIKVLEQKSIIGENVDRSPEIKAILPHLEKMYDTRVKVAGREGTLELSPEMEELLWKTMGKDVGKA